MRNTAHLLTSQHSADPGSGRTPIGAIAILSMVVLFSVTVAAVVLLTIYAPDQAAIEVTAVIGVLSTICAGLFGILRQGQETHVALNGRLSEYLESERRRASAETALRVHEQTGTVPGDDIGHIVKIELPGENE
jgi:hypothetical protein